MTEMVVLAEASSCTLRFTLHMPSTQRSKANLQLSSLEHGPLVCGPIARKKSRNGEGRAYAQPYTQDMIRIEMFWEVKETQNIEKKLPAHPGHVVDSHFMV